MGEGREKKERKIKLKHLKNILDQGLVPIVRRES